MTSSNGRARTFAANPTALSAGGAFRPTSWACRTGTRTSRGELSLTHSGKVRAIFFIVGDDHEQQRMFMRMLPDPPPTDIRLPTFNPAKQDTNPDAKLQLGELPCRLLYLEGEAVDKQLTAEYLCLQREEKVNVLNPVYGTWHCGHRG